MKYGGMVTTRVECDGKKFYRATPYGESFIVSNVSADISRTLATWPIDQPSPSACISLRGES